MKRLIIVNLSYVLFDNFVLWIFDRLDRATDECVIEVRIVFLSALLEHSLWHDLPLVYPDVFSVDDHVLYIIATLKIVYLPIGYCQAN